MYPVIDSRALFEYLSNGACIITPNNRLAASLLQEATEEGYAFFEKPRCLPFSSLMRETFHAFCHEHPQQAHPVLLSPCQLRHLWQEVLQAHSVRGSERLLPLATEAYDRLQAWEVNPQDIDFETTQQTARFNAWRSAFEARLKALDALTESQLPAYLLQQNAFHRQKGPFIWACFDEFTPIQQSVQKALIAAGGEQLIFERKSETPAGTLFLATDETQEFQALLSWLRHQLAAGHAHIGVVIPDLQTRADTLRRQLAAVLDENDFTLSLAEPLAHHPLCAHALCVLMLNSESLTRHEALLLLTSPWIGASLREYWQRANFAHRNKLLQESGFTGKAFCSELEPVAPILANLLAHLRPYPAEASPMQWARLFSERLEAFGFPGETSMDSRTWQYFQRFSTLFEEFQSLGFITPIMRREDALQTFRQLSATTLFEPRQEKRAPIQVSGLLEASGCRFDHLWIGGMANDALPASSSPSPLLPIPLQQALEMPHASPERELRFALQLIERLRASSESSVFSVPLLLNAVPQQPSPLVTDLPRWEPVLSVAETPQLETLCESWRLPLLPEETPSGGTRLLQDQAQCPFKAFAAHRLHLKAAQPLSDGPSRMERGILIHAILERLWKTLQTQERLRKLPAASLEKLINDTINEALKALQWRTHSFSPLMQEVERDRLRHLLFLTLEQEKAREAFTVEALEDSRTLSIGGLTLNLRIDRIDRLENGEQWVIDYKSSLPGKPWRDERPEEPQLLLYALLEDAIAGVCYWAIGKGESRLLGVGTDAQSMEGIEVLSHDAWTKERAAWRERLEALAKEFSEGHCAPEPRDSLNCEKCDFGSVCRFRDPG